MNTEMNEHGKEDEDCLFLEKVLDKLYDFGNKPTTKKKSKKKKRKRCEEEDDPENACSDDNAADHQHQQSRPEQTDELIQQKNQVEVVIFQDPRKKLKTKQTPVPENTPPLQTKEKKHKEQPEELSLEKARLEVHRFGITGYKKEEQRVFEQDRAVMLGARPPKKEYVNYKVLQQQLKEKKQKEKEEVHPDLKKKKKQNNPRDKKKATPSGPGSGSAPSGQVGRFKNGMLILSTKEIQKIKGSKRGR
ncbi:40S small subunit processome assembly factor 1 isoform X2 [Sphaeramia orbicularis]|uniref:Uncharacterized protein n=1 Tax=Sphaeramia orbicularis TaxID=375764 RepID=A0A673B4G2_9TELE|nr:uncharacterized protein C1orf131 homolog isoform X2 [Sphaeramia orbicularis]